MLAGATAALCRVCGLARGDGTVAAACRVPAVVSHRGEPAQAPENTMASFSSALRGGGRLVELDVRFTSDGMPVVMHDPTLDRTTDGSGQVTERTLAQVRAVDAGRGQRVPVLAEPLRLARRHPGARVVVELKEVPDAVQARRIVRTISAAGMRRRVIVQSFRPAALHAVRALGPDLLTARLAKAADVPDTEQARRDGTVINVAAAAATRDRVRDWHRAGLRVWVWTVNDRAGWERAHRAGADGVVTDRTRDYLAWADTACR